MLHPKSFEYVRAHNQAVGALDYVEPKEEITVDYASGSSKAVTMHDGSKLVLHKLDKGHDPRDSDAAIQTIRSNAAKGEVATGLLYINEQQEDLHDVLATDNRPLNALPMSELCPGAKGLEGVNARLR